MGSRLRKRGGRKINVITSSGFIAEDQQIMSKVYKFRNRSMTAMRKTKSEEKFSEGSPVKVVQRSCHRKIVKGRVILYIAWLLYSFKFVTVSMEYFHD